jgi:hypothetical protein
MSQRAKILQLLERRGEQGVHSFEFYEMHMPRAAAVICQLRKEGYAIESERETFHGESQGVRYFLRATELVPGAAEPELVAAGGSESSNAYDPYSEWA